MSRRRDSYPACTYFDKQTYIRTYRHRISSSAYDGDYNQRARVAGLARLTAGACQDSLMVHTLSYPKITKCRCTAVMSPMWNEA